MTFLTSHGLLEIIVSDNSPALTSEELCLSRTSCPYHPASNGLAERCVQTFKGSRKTSGPDIETKLAFQYRITTSS